MVTRKKFKSSDNKERYIAMTNGHCFRIAGEWVDVPEWAWSECYAAGCISEDILKGLVAEAAVDPRVSKDVDRREQIKATLKRWVADNEVDKFTAGGKPKLKDLNEELGWVTSKGIVYEIWFNIQEGK